MKIKKTHSSPTASNVKVPSQRARDQWVRVPPHDHQRRHPASPPAGTGSSPESLGEAPPLPSCH